MFWSLHLPSGPPHAPDNLVEIKSNVMAATQSSAVQRRLHPQQLKEGTALNHIGKCSAVCFDKGGGGRRKEDGFVRAVNPAPGTWDS